MKFAIAYSSAHLFALRKMVQWKHSFFWCLRLEPSGTPKSSPPTHEVLKTIWGICCSSSTVVDAWTCDRVICFALATGGCSQGLGGGRHIGNNVSAALLAAVGLDPPPPVAEVRGGWLLVWCSKVGFWNLLEWRRGLRNRVRACGASVCLFSAIFTRLLIVTTPVRGSNQPWQIAPAV